MSANKNPRYGPIPSRSCHDQRFSAAHFRVLVAIASFDRIGKNGQGCWASQNKIAEIVDCSKAHLSNILSDLRDWGYITSKLNPDHRRLRVHRVVYTERDFDFVETPKTGPSRRNKIVHPGVNHSESIVHQQNTDSSLGDELSVHSSKKNDSKNNDLQNATIVKTITKTIEDRDSLSWRGRDCAEAHSKSLPLADAEKYLANCEHEAATGDRDGLLKYERQVIAEIADDACLPEAVNQRAAKLLAQLPTDK